MNFRSASDADKHRERAQPTMDEAFQQFQEGRRNRNAKYAERVFRKPQPPEKRPGKGWLGLDDEKGK